MRGLGQVLFASHLWAGVHELWHPVLTGLALLLSALGVARATVLEDYLLTARSLDPDRELKHVLALVPTKLRPPMTRETIRPVFEVRPEYLSAALAAMVETSGSVEGYLEERLGVGPAERQELMDRYLTS